MTTLSIVSPSFNQAAFVPATLASVTAQGDAVLEHIIQDGGSTDGTADILRAYAARTPKAVLKIGPDGGQANAINEGFGKARGDIIAWLNTDDVYADDDVCRRVLALFDRFPEIDVIYGRGRFVAPNGETLREAWINDDGDALKRRFIHSVGILQPALFMRRRIFERFGPLDEAMRCAFDYEYWTRLAAGGARFLFVDETLALASWHDDAKTNKTRGQSFSESADVAQRHYGFAPVEWLERLASNEIAGANGIFDQLSQMPQAVRADIFKRRDQLFAERNATRGAQSKALSLAHVGEARRSVEAVRAMLPYDWSRVLVTTFDAAYFEQGLTLIAAIHRNAATNCPILVYDLGLSATQRAQLLGLKDVFVLDYPRELAGAYPEYFSPKSYVYKLLAMAHVRQLVDDGSLILWIDAGVSPERPIAPLFDKIAADGVFFVDHDDRPIWPFHNMTFITDAAIKALNATHAELAGLHLCSCLMGYTAGGRFEALFQEAYRHSLSAAASLGDKHPPPAEKIEREGSAAAADLRRRAGADAAFAASLSPQRMRALFGYLGHRQDQTILSVMAARHGAPLSSAKTYCVSTDRSSEASKLHWESGGASKAVKPVRETTEFPASLTLHHRGTYRNLDGLDFGARPARRAIVMGNGPSLKGFDFARLKPFDTFGCNVAYRYWDQIGWYPTHYSCLDKVVGVDHAEAIARLITNAEQYGIKRFLLRRNLIEILGKAGTSERVFDFDLLMQAHPAFARLPITTGSHTTIWAAALGYKDIALIGVDCNYVELVPGAEARGGTMLEIAKDGGENPNYFFAGYQRVGDKYNVPNSNPSGDLHIDSWRAAALSAAELGAVVVNANTASKVDAFEFCTFDELEAAERPATIPAAAVLGLPDVHPVNMQFPREARAGCDEPGFVFSALGGAARKGVMIDIGAHWGGSLIKFAKAGWTVLAFEPDPVNRTKLQTNLGKLPNLKISSEAVSDRAAKGVSFFSSDVSTGISGLSAFHESHKEAAKVDITTLNDIVARENLQAIDFLKIDVEGFERDVLLGLDFRRIAPRALVVEFEDSKTRPRGYSTRDMIEMLTVHGYAVYVSEWYSIERYGVKHSFRRLFRYDGTAPEPQSWGNLIAFARDPGLAAITAALTESVDVPLVWDPRLEAERKAERERAMLSRQADIKAAGTRRLVVVGPDAPASPTGVATLSLDSAIESWIGGDWRPSLYACLERPSPATTMAIYRLLDEPAGSGPRRILLRRSLIETLDEADRLRTDIVDFDAIRPVFADLEAAGERTTDAAVAWARLMGYRAIA